MQNSTFVVMVKLGKNILYLGVTCVFEGFCLLPIRRVLQ
jgi:hypothetical protein